MPGKPTVRGEFASVGLSAAGGFGTLQRQWMLYMGLPWVIGGMQAMVYVFVATQPVLMVSVCTLETARLGCRPHPIDDCPTDPSLYELAGDIHKSVVSEFGLACENSSWAVALQSEFFLGFLVGVWGIGWLADRVGRKPALWMSAVVTQLFGLLSFVAPSYIAYAISRLGVGLGVGGLGLSSYVLAAEVTAPEWRSLVCAGTSSIFAIGIVAVSGLAAIPGIHWRLLSFSVWMLSWACVLPALLLTRFLESPVWLEAQGRHGEAEAGLRKIAIVNNRLAEFDSFLRKWDDELTADADGNLSIEEGERGGPSPVDEGLWGYLLRSRLNIIQEFMAVMVAAWFASSLGYYGLSMNVGHLGGNIYVNSILNALVEIPSYGVMYFMVDNAVTGRKLTLVIYLLAAGVACMVCPFFTYLHWLSLTIALIGKFFISAAFGVCYIYGAELFPTSIRSSALGIQSLAARIAGIISPLIPPLGGFWSPLPDFIFGIPCIVAAGLTLRFLPETLGRNLPMSVEDVRGLRYSSVGGADGPRPGHGRTHGKYEMPLEEFDTDSSDGYDDEDEEEARRAETLRDVFGTEFAPRGNE